MILIQPRVRRGRLIRIVRIIEVHPDEVWSCRMRIQPRFGAVSNVHPAALYPAPSGFGLGVLGKVVVVIESAVQTWRQGSTIQNHRANKGCRAIPLLLEQFGPGNVGWR